MQKKKEGTLSWMTYDIFNDLSWIRQGTFLRGGGISKEPYDSLNLSFEVGDEEKCVRANREKIFPLMGSSDLVEGIQNHGKNVALVGKETATPIPSCDAWITQEAHRPLLAKHADCQAAIFVDPIQRAVGVAHAGWRGNVSNIYREIICAMQQAFGSKPENLLVAISPSLGPCHAEFQNFRNEFPEEYWDYQIKPYFFDLWALALDQLIAEGVKESHIEIARLCTYDTPEECFSFRRERTTGRHGTFISIQ